MNFSVFTKPICRFLIHRYMGQYLKTEISSDQLEFRLADGTASVQKVALNTEYINEILDSVGVVSLVDGFVEEISACVPWKKLMTESTVIKISGLGLTLTPLSDINMANTQELVSSMIGSIASSMDLARSVIADEQIADGAENAGVEQFASLIDQVISRIKVIFENLTIRVEAYSDICTGIEIQIDRMEFHDEQLEARQQLEQPGQAITEQPASLYTVTDLNKLLHLQGVRLYTDIWTRNSLAIDRLTPSHTNSSEDEADGTMTSSSLNFQSCYSHFSHRSTRSSLRATAALSSSEPCIPPTPVLFAQFVSDTRVRVRVNNTALSSCNENSAFNKRVDIDILVGGSLHALLTPSQIALLRDLFSRLVPKRVECTAAWSGAAAAAYGGLPMKEEHFQKITDQFMVPDGSGGSANFNFSNFSNRSTWSGAEQFYELLPQLNSAASGTSGKLTARGPTAPTLPHSSLTSLQRSCSLESTLSKDQKSNASTATLVERRPDIFTITLRVPTLVAVISHDDPLSEQSMKRRTDERGNGDKSQPFYSIRTVCHEMAEHAEGFFFKATRVKLAKHQLEEQRGLLSDLFSGDHLSLVTSGAVFSLTLVNEHLRNSLQIEGSFEECDFMECLLPASVVMKEGDSNDKTTHHHHHFDVLNLSERRDIASRDVFTFRMHNSPERSHRIPADELQEYNIEVNMERCKSDVDISIIDRIRHLIVPKPCFLPDAYPSSIRPANSAAGGGDSSLGPFAGLRDNFLSDTVHSNPRSTFTVKFYVSEWSVDFRIPIADFSPERREECWMRSVHGEHLHAVMKGATLRLPKFSPSNFSHCGELILEAKSAIVSLIGDPASLSCTETEMKFLHAFNNNNNNNEDEMDKYVKLRLSCDSRNKSLRSANVLALGESTAPSGLMAKSMFESIFRPRDEDKVEGPFSRTSSYFADTRLVMAGSRTELEEFSEECRPQARMNLELSIPHLNILLPSHKFVEVLYNRLANDLALWEPKCLQLKEANRRLSGAAANPPQAIFRPFMNCSGGKTMVDYDEGEENEEDDDKGGISLSAHGRYAPRFKRKQRVPSLASVCSSHQLTLTLRVERAHLLIKAGEEHHPAPGSDHATANAGNIAAQLSQAELFLVHGFRENANLSYLYLTSTKASIYHRNLPNAGANSFCADVESSKFACGRRDEIQAEPVPAGEPCALVSDDNVAVCLKLLQHPNENIKDLLLAVALRNTLIHVNPITDSKQFWATQLADFFTLIDYEIPGYEIPIVKIDLHVHLSSMLLGYNHSTIAPHSPMQLRLEIGSCDVTAQLLTQDMERFKFRCLLEDVKLWLRKRRREKVAFVEGAGGSGDPVVDRDPFVKVAAVGLMHLLVAYTVASSIPSISSKSASDPMLELTCVNDVIKIWVCTDTMVELLNMAIEFYQSDMGTYLFSSRPASPIPRRASSSTHQPRERGDKSDLLVDFVNNHTNAKASFTHRATTAGTNDRQLPPSGQKELSEEERNRLVAMMASAMEDDPQVAILAAAVKTRRSGRSKGGSGEEPQLAEIFSEDLAEEVTSDVDHSSTSTTTTTNTDDEFIVVEKIPSASYGVTRMGGNRPDPDFEIVQTPYRIPPDVITGEDATQAGLSTPLNHPPAILRYSISDVSLCVCLYGGSDFGDFPARPQKTYSQWETHRNSGECAEARRESEGGKYRDHTVCVEVKVSKMSFLCEIFNAISPILSLNVLKISDIEVVDRVSACIRTADSRRIIRHHRQCNMLVQLLVSEINKLFYKHVNYDAPKRLQASLLSVQMVEDQLREGKLAVSLAPIRLNFDQDTLEFLQEFSSYVSSNVKWPESPTSHDPKADLPVIEVPPLQRKVPTLHVPEQTSSQEQDFVEDREVKLNFGGVKFNKRPTPPLQPKQSTSSALMQDFTDPPPNLEDLFSEDDVHIDDTFCAGLSRELERGEIGSESSISLDLKNNNDDDCDDNDDDEGDDGRPIIDLEHSTRVEATEKVEEELPEAEMNPSSRVQSVQPQRDTFFKEFTFSPACRIRLDYVGKRVKTEQGALIGLLVGLADLHRTELVLKELHNQRGLLGLNRCVQYALDEWLQDVRGQIPNVIGSYTPISALVQLTQGIRDLFAIPLCELRREDGQLMRGLQQGASNFGISTASAAIDATQRVASIVQSVAELAFDIVSPDYSLQRQRYSRSSQSGRPRVASDFREGVAMAYDTVSEGVRETAQVLQTAAQEDRASGGTQWGLRGLLRHATPTAIRPIVIASQATVQVLGGIRNSLHPEDHREAMEKWRRREVPGRLVNQQQLRQSYNPSSLVPSQRYIPPPASSSFSHDRY